jgi:hypothetical protein
MCPCSLGRAVTLMGMVAAAGGCYTYRPLAGQDPVPQTEISLTLTDSGSVALAAEVGPRVRKLHGKVLEVTPAAYRLAMIESTDHRGIETLWRGEPVTVPRGLTAGADERRFSTWKTVVAAAGGVFLVVGTGVAISEAASSGGDKPPGPPK